MSSVLKSMLDRRVESKGGSCEVVGDGFEVGGMGGRIEVEEMGGRFEVWGMGGRFDVGGMGGRFKVVGGGFEVGGMGDRFGVGGTRGGGEFEVGRWQTDLCVWWRGYCRCSPTFLTYLGTPPVCFAYVSPCPSESSVAFASPLRVEHTKNSQ